MIPAGVARAPGGEVAEMRPVGGGDVDRAAYVPLADGREAFVKRHAWARDGTWTAEAEGCEWLRVPDGPRLPRVLAVAEGPGGLLAREWLPPSRRAADHDERMGRQLAALHRAAPPRSAGAATTGSTPLPQANPPCATWAGSLAEGRIAPLLARARDAGAPGPGRRAGR